MISMKAYIQNLRKADLTLERTKQLDEELSASACLFLWTAGSRVSVRSISREEMIGKFTTAK